MHLHYHYRWINKLLGIIWLHLVVIQMFKWLEPVCLILSFSVYLLAREESAGFSMRWKNGTSEPRQHVSLKDKGRAADIIEVSDSHPHPALCRRAFFNGIWENAPCAACFTTQKPKCESLKESNASGLNWTPGFLSSSIKAISWRDGGLCGAVFCPSKPAHMWCSLRASQAWTGKTCTH